MFEYIRVFKIILTMQYRMLLFVEYLTVCIYDARMCEVAVGLEDRMVTSTISLCNCICKGRLLTHILLNMT